MRIAAVLILYYPDKDLLLNISSYLASVEKLYVYDNTDDPQIHEINRGKLNGLDKVKIEYDGVNEGISKRLNQACLQAKEDGFEWLLTMDQDSIFNGKTFEDYLACINNFNDQDQVAMFGIQYSHDILSKQSCVYEQVPHLITSGSIINIKVGFAIGLFDEALFIDKVDHEYCWRAILNNYKIIRINNIYLKHSLGKVHYGRSLKNLRKTPRIIHSPIRMYYIIRNYFYLKEKYKNQFITEFKELQEEIIIRTKNNFLYGKNKIALIKYIIKAYNDFRKGKMGKITF